MALEDRPPVDTRRERSVSFARPVAPAAAEGRAAHPGIPVGPGRSAIEAPPFVSRGQQADVSGYPVQPSKVQPPPLRDETLARDRLLDWLHVKIHHRLVYVTAEAGYGKTTLLADFSRRSRLRTLWYRLDEEDGTWIPFLSHLLAAGREHDPGFAPSTAGLLGQIPTGGPSLDVALETFVREIQPLGETGAVVVLDDYHLVDEAPDIRLIMRELLARAPERVTFVLASRRPPLLPVARLRAQGEVAELGTNDLRFNESETEQLFRETYKRPLEPDVLNDLSRRTEGWAASLQLVQAAIRDRSAGEVRSFVRSLSGAEGDLYDYLAEEVIGKLPDDLQDFLSRVALLSDVTPALMEAATRRSPAEVAALAQAGERSGLLSRGHVGFRGKRGFHPLVRQFLRDRLEREVGSQAIRDIHRTVAHWPGTPWHVACLHLAQAGDHSDVVAVLRDSVRSVLGGGGVALAAGYVRQFGAAESSSATAMILSRAELQAGQPGAAVALAREAYSLEATTLTAINLASVLTLTGDLQSASELVRNVDPQTLDTVSRDIAVALEELMLLSVEGDLEAFVRRVERMAKVQIEEGLLHYAGVSLLNGATALRAQGDAARCLSFADQAIQALTESAAPTELVSAALVRDWAVSHLGNERERVDLRQPLLLTRPDVMAEAMAEAATTETWYGDADRARLLLGQVPIDDVARTDLADLVNVAKLELALRVGAIADAEGIEALLADDHLSPEPAHRTHQLSVRSYLELRTGRASAAGTLAEAESMAIRQGAHFWSAYCALLRAWASTQQGQAFSLPPSAIRDPAYLSLLAEVVVQLLSYLGDSDFEAVRAAAQSRPKRWLAPLRATAADMEDPSRWQAAELLNEVGEQIDVALLRRIGKTAKAGSPYRHLGKQLARRLAPRVFVEDEGRVSLLIGGRRVEGQSLRRKVLALLCLLLTRHDLSATKDEVLDALWPDLEPDVAVNSLNQTVYFLRRVFEPDYAEQTSPDFVRFDSNVVWLDMELVGSRSQECWKLIKAIGSEARPGAVEVLARTYLGKFALDFAYEEWAIPYRDALHAGYLHVMEAAVASDTATGHYDRGIRLARAAITVDPTAENLEVSLVRLYRMAGAHAAAAEQYEHYAATLRNEFGLEPPPIDSL